ncbi:MAG TPA: hypothetical protein VKN99_24395 [Polyangia bacterium]|nr:hypothetical protein [Polyangia bacterium]
MAAFLLGCATRAQTPEEAVRAYVRAVERNDPVAAYVLLSAEARREVSRDQFAARWRDNREAARADLTALREGAARGATEEARVVYGEGLFAPLVLDQPPAPAGWHLSDVPTPRSPHAATPEEALRGFLRAIEGRDWEAIGKLVAPSTREAVERELRERTGLLRDAKRVEVSGDKARVRFGRFELDLERSASGEWRVAGIK